ncbi:MAG: hypothetical protein M0Z55_07285 [Peptococcaceae bacterium]|nr:hypothetical protein [Peptococcaceae bacterium]
MYYSIRPAGLRSRSQQIQYYMMLVAASLKLISTLALLFMSVIAVLTANYGALAFLFILFLLSGIIFNLFRLRAWLPGWRQRKWFARAVYLSIYVFIALAVLLVVNPLPQ